MQGLIEVTGLWTGKDKNGDGYLSGSLGAARVFIFRNKRKEKEAQPDYRLFVTERRKREDSEARQPREEECPEPSTQPEFNSETGGAPLPVGSVAGDGCPF